MKGRIGCAMIVVATASSCREPTQITVEVTTDIPCNDLRGTTLTIGELTGLDLRPITAQTTTCNAARIGSIVVVPSSGDDDLVAIRVVAGIRKDPSECMRGGPGCVVARRALRFVPHRALSLPISIAASCDGIACNETETCVRGECRRATIDDSAACADATACSENVLPPGVPVTPTPVAVVALPEWTKRRMLTIDNTGIARLVDFPVLVVLDATRIDYASATPNGADIRLTDASGLELAYEIERWDAPGRSFLWVRVPVIEANSRTVLSMYYGNAAARDGQRATAVWDADYVGVYHLAEDRDSTGKHTPTNRGGVRVTGQIGPAMTFDGKIPGTYFDTGAAENLETWTMDVWFRATDPPNTTIGDSGPISRGFNYEVQWNCNGAAYCRSVNFNTSPGTNLLARFGDPPPAMWHHLVATYDKTELRTYLAGERKDTKAGGGVAAGTDTGTALLGKRPNFEGYYRGDVDEARISRIARSEDYVRADYRSMTDAYVTYGPETANR